MMVPAFGELTTSHVFYLFLPRHPMFFRGVALSMCLVYIRMVLFLPYCSFLCLDQPFNYPFSSPLSSGPCFRVSLSHNLHRPFSRVD